MNSFDAEKHEYRIDGTVVPSVTQIIDGLGGIDKSFYDDYSRQRGTYVHQTVAMWLQERLDEDELDPDLKGYLDSFRAAWEHLAGRHETEILSLENPLFNNLQHYAGTPDIVCRIDGQAVIIDLKSGKPMSWTKLQVQGYAGLICDADDMTVPWEGEWVDCYTLELDKDGRMGRLQNAARERCSIEIRDGTNDFFRLVNAWWSVKDLLGDSNEYLRRASVAKGE